MRPRNTLILFVLVAAAAAALWYFELREGAKPESDGAQQKVFAGLDAKQVEWIEIAQADGSVARLEKRGEDWRLTKPLDFAADRFHADGVASGLAELASETVYDSAAEDPVLRPEARESYGLTREPRVRFSAAGKEHALRIGDPTPVAGNTYVTDADGKRVFAVPTWQTNAFTKTVKELREPRLLIFDRDELAKLTLAWTGGGATLAKQDGAWRVVAPIDDAADDAVLQSLLSDFQGLRAEEFLDAPPPDDALGLGAPVFRAELTLEGGTAPLVLTLGGPREGARIAARGGAGFVAEIAASQLERMPKTVAVLRDKALASFGVADAKSFTLTFSAPGAAALTVKGTITDDGWKTEPAMEPGAASALVAELAALNASDIAVDALGDAELAALGLAPPRVAIRVLGEGEGDAAKPLADVRLGAHQAGKGIAAQRAERPVVYWLAESLSEQLPLSAAQFHEKFAAKQDEAAVPPPEPTKPAVSPPPPPGE